MRSRRRGRHLGARAVQRSIGILVGELSVLVLDFERSHIFVVWHGSSGAHIRAQFWLMFLSPPPPLSLFPSR